MAQNPFTPPSDKAEHAAATASAESTDPRPTGITILAVLFLATGMLVVVRARHTWEQIGGPNNIVLMTLV